MSKFSLYHPHLLDEVHFLDVIYVYTVTIKKTLGMSLCHIAPAFVHHLLDDYLV